MLLSRENGKTRREIFGEIAAAIRIWRGYAEEAKRIFGKAIPLDSVPGRETSLAITIRQPRGVVVAIVPFNYPVELWSHKAAGALAAGNAVITKPPEECPLTVIRIAAFLEEAGLPRAAHQVVTGPGETVGAALVRAPGVQMVAMTGSTAAGRHIAHAAADTLKKVHLELGGNDATIVCADADPQSVASDLIAGRFTSGNGQICCAVKRVLVDEFVYDDLLDALVAKTKSLTVGDPLSDDTDVGPLINEEAAVNVEAQVRKAVAEGAKVVAGGTRNGTFYAPTILTGVKSGQRRVQGGDFRAGPVPDAVRNIRRRPRARQRQPLRPAGGDLHPRHRAYHAGFPRTRRRDCRGQPRHRHSRREPALRRDQAQRQCARGSARDTARHDRAEDAADPRRLLRSRR